MAKNNGCLIQKLYPDGTFVRLRQLPAEGGSYFAALNRDRTHIDKSMSVQFCFDFGDELFAGGVVRAGPAFNTNLQVGNTNSTISGSPEAGSGGLEHDAKLTTQFTSLGDFQEAIRLKYGECRLGAQSDRCCGTD